MYRKCHTCHIEFRLATPRLSCAQSQHSCGFQAVLRICRTATPKEEGIPSSICISEYRQSHKLKCLHGSFPFHLLGGNSNQNGAQFMKFFLWGYTVAQPLGGAKPWATYLQDRLGAFIYNSGKNEMGGYSNESFSASDSM